MEWVEKWPSFVRWILFIPAFFIAYFLSNIILSWSIARFMGPRDISLFNEIIYTIQGDFIAMLAGFYVSCKVIPKGKIILSIVYSAFALVVAGINIALFITNQSEPTLPVVLSTIAFPSAAGITLFAFINEWRNEVNKATESEYSV